MFEVVVFLACRRATPEGPRGPGATLRLQVGGRSGYGAPLVLDATVQAFRAQHSQTGLLGEPEALGASAWIRARGCDIVLCSLRTQTYHPDAFTSLGLDLPNQAVILVKSAWHHEAAFAPLAETLSASEDQIAGELLAVQGSPADIGGYYRPDPDKTAAVMRPSATLNAAIDQLGS